MPAIYGTNHVMDLHLALLHRDFGHLRGIAADIVDHREPRACPAGSGLPQPASPPPVPKHRAGAGFRQQPPAKLHRIFPPAAANSSGSSRRRTYSACTPPRANRSSECRRRAVVVDGEVRDPYSRSLTPSMLVRSTPLGIRRTRGRRRACPCDGPAVRVHARQLRVRRRPVRSCCMSSSRDQVTFTGLPSALATSTASPTKSTPPRRPNPPPINMGVDLDLIRRKPVSSPRPLAPRSGSASTPTLRSVGPHVGGAIHRLHGSVREIRRFVDGLDFLRAVGQRRVGVPSLRATAPASKLIGEHLPMPAL